MDKGKYTTLSLVLTQQNDYNEGGQKACPLKGGNMKDFTIELTKLEKILEVNNSMCHNYYYLQYGRIYNADKTQFRRFKFVIWNDIDSVCDYYEKDFVTNEEIRRYMGECAWVTCDTEADYLIRSFDDCQEFYDWCNKTIEDFNK